MNEVTRLEYVKDCNVGVTRWNMGIKRAGVDFELKLPSTRFRRAVGVWAGVPDRPAGPADQRRPSSTRRRTSWLPTDGRHRLRQEPDAARDRAGQDGRLDRAAGPRHQCQPGRVRVREAVGRLATVAADASTFGRPPDRTRPGRPGRRADAGPAAVAGAAAAGGRRHQPRRPGPDRARRLPDARPATAVLSRRHGRTAGCAVPRRRVGRFLQGRGRIAA